MSGDINRKSANQLRDAYERRNPDNDCILVLTTFGGDPAAAYIMARFLREGAARGFKAFITGRCKSAGTLVALGARRIVMGSKGELGPLDIQVSEKDEPFRQGSGLELFVTLNSLAQQAFSAFETYLLQLIGKTGSEVSMKTAAKIATELTVGIMAPISGQIDPLQLGRREREMGIVRSYAERLKIPDEVVWRLATDYQDHGFVIDLTEAKEFLREQVRAPNPEEARLESALATFLPNLYDPHPHPKDPIVLRLNDLPGQVDDTQGDERNHGEESELRGRQERDPAEVDEERQKDSAEIHQADTIH